ncbi:MAG: tRNA pseudouridine(55) synthase TruB [Candidatus Omnitrophota bacterium]|nr:tRNA pseudouridine(55) synthase TruB [Candidatus Omnitrophota bacterium]
METHSVAKKEGILLVNKPIGITSHDVVDIVRGTFKMKAVGHAGTLDPLAEGLLVILVGKATKLFASFVNFDKEYIGVLKLGQITTTGDSQGPVIKHTDYQGISLAQIDEAFSRFSGEMEQIPPMVSALRMGGKRLYSLARKGITIDRPARKIKIYSLQIKTVDLPLVEFYVHCSKGTYVRKLAEDIGELLGCGAHVIKIKRLSIGPFKLDDAINVDVIDEKYLRPFIRA